jgi:peptidoglycan/LPS O-acetylase OafA/YrhL
MQQAEGIQVKKLERSERQREKAKHYPSLNGLRFIAAMAVVGYHFRPLRSLPGVGPFFATGPAAVGFFFLLSGFVLAFQYPNVSDSTKFWRARLIRIYPMYLFAFLLFFPIALQKYHHDGKALIASFAVNVTMLQAWTSLSQSWNGPSWSLSVEAFLYLVFPFIVSYIEFRRHAAIWMTLSLLPSALTVAFYLHLIPETLWHTWIRNSPLFWLPVFCFGVALGKWRSGFSALPERSFDGPIVVLLGLVAMLTAIWIPQYREILIDGLAAPLFGLIVVMCTFHAPWIGRMLGNPAMDRLGSASYIIYIIQAPLWHYSVGARNLISGRPLYESTVGMRGFLCYVLILICVSLLIDRLIDKPVREWINRYWKIRALAISNRLSEREATRIV